MINSRGIAARAVRFAWGRVAASAAASASGLATALFAGACCAAPAQAQHIENGIAVFAALDKVTARISTLEVKLGETKEFGALRVTPRACYTRPPTEPPKTTSFVEVDEVMLDGSKKRVFSGWMFAESPGLNAVEHPVFDVWLTKCSDPQHSVSQRPGAREHGASRAGDADEDDERTFRRRPRR